MNKIESLIDDIITSTPESVDSEPIENALVSLVNKFVELGTVDPWYRWSIEELKQILTDLNKDKDVTFSGTDVTGELNIRYQNCLAASIYYGYGDKDYGHYFIRWWDNRTLIDDDTPRIYEFKTENDFKFDGVMNEIKTGIDIIKEDLKKWKSIKDLPTKNSKT